MDFRTGDGGPSLSMITSSIKPKGKLMDVICEALEMDQARKERTVSSMVVQSPMRHPGCAPSKLLGFGLLIS